MTGTTVTAFSLDDPAGRQRYDALFARCPDAFIQQSTRWAEVIAPLGPDHATFLLAERDGVAVAGLPLYRFDGPAGAVMTSVPQAGPLGGIFAAPELTPDLREDAYAALLAAAVAAARDGRCRTLTLITDPLAGDIGLYRRHLRPDLEFENFTQWVPVDDVVTDGRMSLPGMGRVRRARIDGLTVRQLPPDDFAEWYDLHVRRHQELGAPPLPRALLHGLMQHLWPRGECFLLGVEHQGQLVSGGQFVLHRNVCDVFITGMDRRYGNANYALTAAALEECARRGVAVMNWQSSAARGNGVYLFKAQWRARDVPYFFVTRLLDDPAPLLALGKAGLAAAYPWHYVLPFGLFDQPEARSFRKP